MKIRKWQKSGLVFLLLGFGLNMFGGYKFLIAVDEVEAVESEVAAPAKKEAKEKESKALGSIKNFGTNFKKEFDRVVRETNYDTSEKIKFSVSFDHSEMGFEVDFGFAGSGDIEKGFEAVPVTKIAKGTVTTIISTALQVPLKALGFPVDKLDPDQVFLMKMLNLIVSYSKEKRFFEIPLEMDLLVARLLKTVDQKASAAARKTVYYKSPIVILDKAPSFLKSLFDQIKLNITEENYQRWQDWKEGLTQTNLAYSSIRSISDYDSRVDKAKEKIADLLKKPETLTFSDRRLITYLFERLVFERGDASAQVISGLKDAVSLVIEAFQKIKLSGKDVDSTKFLQESNKEQIKRLEDLKLVLDGKQEMKKAPLLRNSKTLKTMKRIVNIKDYLEYLFYLSQKNLNRKFKGDAGYFYDDSLMNSRSSLEHAVAIAFRAFKDIGRIAASAEGKKLVEDILGTKPILDRTKLASVKVSKTADGNIDQIATLKPLITKEGTKVQGELSSAELAYKIANSMYSKASESEKETFGKWKDEAKKALTSAQNKYVKSFAEFAKKAILVKVKPDPKKDYSRSIKDFLIEEYAKLLFKRTRLTDEMKKSWAPKLNPLLSKVGISFDDIVKMAQGALTKEEGPTVSVDDIDLGDLGEVRDEEDTPEIKSGASSETAPSPASISSDTTKLPAPIATDL